MDGQLQSGCKILRLMLYLIKEELNWSANVSLEEGVQVMLENIEYWRQAPVWDPAMIAEATRDWFKYLGEKD